MLKKIIATVILLTCCVFAQDVIVNTGKNPYVNLVTNAAWNTVNSNFIFPTYQPFERYCLFVKNNNPTNAHVISIVMFETSNPSLIPYASTAGVGWIIDPLMAGGGAGIFTSVAANGVYTYCSRTNGATYIAAVITNGSTQAGTPDTATISVSQSTANYFDPPKYSLGTYVEFTTIGKTQFSLGNANLFKTNYLLLHSLTATVTQGAVGGMVQVGTGSGSNCATTFIPMHEWYIPANGTLNIAETVDYIVAPVATNAVVLCINSTQTVTQGVVSVIVDSVP